MLPILGIFAVFLHIFQQTSADILILPYKGKYIEEVFRDAPANFGPEVPYPDLQAKLQYAVPADACTPINKPPPDDNKALNWVVLVSRLNCSFEQKVRNGQEAGYQAVIVHNVNSDDLQTMDAKNSTGINIPSVFVAETSGLIMMQMYANPHYYIVINRAEPFDINKNLLMPFAIVIAICFFVMVTFMIVKYIKIRNRLRRLRLSSSTLNKIPVHKFAKGDPYDTCAICLDDYLENEKLRVLPCAHAYHCKCIDPWLTKNRRVCPVCKRKVFAHDETPYDDTDDSDSDADDRTPLVNPSNRDLDTNVRTPLVNSASRVTHGGTFDEESENPFQRAARSISQQISDDVNFVTTSGHHSINADQTDNTSTDASGDYIIPGAGPSQFSPDPCSTDEVHTHTRPSTSSEEKNDVIV